MKRRLTALLFLAGYLTGITMAFAQVKNEEGTLMAPVVFDDKIEFWAELNEEGNVYMDWSKYSRPDEFTYYKIVRSQTNTNPVYPDDGYIFYTDDKNLLNYTDTEVPAGASYYRICQIAGTKRYCSSEVKKIVNKPALTGLAVTADAAKNVNLATLDSSKIEAAKVASSSEVNKAAEALNFVDPAALEEFKKLPVVMQNYVRRKILAGEEFTKDELIKLPAGIRDDVASLVERNKRIQLPVQSADKNDTSSKNTSFESFISEYWVQFLALIVSLIGVTLAVTGFTFAGAKKKKSVSRFINEIDDTFASFKWKSKRCEAELYRMQDLVEDKLKQGKIDEGAYHLLMNRIDKYLAEVKDVDGIPNKKS